MSCQHHISPSASFRVFRGPLHGLMPLNTLKNAEIGTGKANRHADITSSLLRLSASSAAHYTQMMPLNTLKNAEFGTGSAKRHADITPSFQRLSASSAANCTK